MSNAPFPMTRKEKIELAVAIAIIVVCSTAFGLTVWAAVHFAMKFW